jgi:hypothetical protein
MKSDIMPDQTQFMAESPLYEEVGLDNAPEKPLSELEIKKRQQKKVMRIIIGLVTFLLVIGGIFAFIKFRYGSEEEASSEIEEVKLDEVIVGPFNQRLLELENELELADPNQEELPFPPIDFEISLEK